MELILSFSNIVQSEINLGWCHVVDMQMNSECVCFQITAVPYSHKLPIRLSVFYKLNCAMRTPFKYHRTMMQHSSFIVISTPFESLSHFDNKWRKMKYQYQYQVTSCLLRDFFKHNPTECNKIHSINRLKKKKKNYVI